mmetsp:Transcript_17962/g.26037  ORF Transcript_17962/g.26037 Transcript_17962/m.26037 type:complete len:633 (+) Transcript_17962:84-1982(+)
MSNDDPVIGIDLGTTYSCLACWDEKAQQVEVIATASGRTLPSWVAFTPTGKLVGASAKAQVASNPGNTVYDIKRIIGRPFSDPVVQDEAKAFPFGIVEGSHGEPKIKVDWRGETKELNPEEISAMVLGELKLAAEKHLGVKVSKAVITVPAHFNNQQRQATKDAGRIAGLNVMRIINEPTAAALSYGLHGQKEAEEKAAAAAAAAEDATKEKVPSNVVIFDLGGGTFDVSILSMDSGVFEVKATGGDTHLGGEDFDNTIFAHCLSYMEEKYGKDVRQKVEKSQRASSRLRRAVEQGKRNLSGSTSVEFEVDSLLPDLNFVMTLTRAEFEKLNGKLFQRCIDTVKDVLVDANVTKDQVTDVVLVGGSTRVPYLQTALYELFEKRVELSKTIHPDEAVAIGAAVQGRILSTGGTGGGKDLTATTTDLLLLDVTPLSLGIELEGRQMSTLIKRNTPIPCRKTRTYTTVSDWQTEIDVVVFEGERPCVDANNKLGSFVISGVERARAGEPKVDVTFALDANGILNVSAKDQVTGSSANATIKAEKGRLTPEDIDRMIADAEKYRVADEALEEKTAYKTALEEALYTAQSKYEGGDEMVEVMDLLDWLELDSENATLDEMKNKGRTVEDRFGIMVAP